MKLRTLPCRVCILQSIFRHCQVHDPLCPISYPQRYLVSSKSLTMMHRSQHNNHRICTPSNKRSLPLFSQSAPVHSLFFDIVQTMVSYRTRQYQLAQVQFDESKVVGSHKVPSNANRLARRAHRKKIQRCFLSLKSADLSRPPNNKV